MRSTGPRQQQHAAGDIFHLADTFPGMAEARWRGLDAAQLLERPLPAIMAVSLEHVERQHSPVEPSQAEEAGAMGPCTAAADSKLPLVWLGKAS